eukprot:Trichotokara_eunicae@DN4346_c0_g1_i1.p1
MYSLGSIKIYELDLELFGEIDPESAEWSFGSVGKLTFTAQKRWGGGWLRLTKSKEKIQNSHVWFDMNDRLAASAKKEREKKERELKELEQESMNAEVEELEYENGEEKFDEEESAEEESAEEESAEE